MSHAYPHRLFEAVGIELEYMIVDAESLDVWPGADRILAEAAGSAHPVADVERGAITWSNDLVLHLLELKTGPPVPTLNGLADRFQAEIREANRLLAGHGARLLGSAMHPWMDPEREARLWPHEGAEIYAALDRIFNCRRHGWANLQSMQVNLPFGDDVEFGRLHSAVRLLLPILPALAASSPFAEGRATGWMDTRVRECARNAERVPSLTGAVVPERVFTRAAYEGELLASLYRDVAPHDRDGILQYEWINARGAIARFDRGAIEIRVVDMQECPRADMAVAAAVVAVVRALVEERWSTGEAQRAWPEAALARHLWATARDAEEAVLDDEAYLATLGWREGRARAGDLWRRLIEATVARDPASAAFMEPLRHILDHGTLARRLLAAGGEHPGPGDLVALARELAACLDQGRLFGERR